jgi:hypothetical protein
MRQIRTSGLMRGRAIGKQAWYAVFRHGRGNPDTRFAVTYTCSRPLSTLLADGTLALAKASAGLMILALARHYVGMSETRRA